MKYLAIVGIFLIFQIDFLFASPLNAKIILELKNIVKRESSNNCNTPPYPGCGIFLVQSWYYNTKTKDCQKFISGACATKNNFPSREVCLKKCASNI
ncbi:unnamed protein product [Gordionus sp. m RMFG-2023]